MWTKVRWQKVAVLSVLTLGLGACGDSDKKDADEDAASAGNNGASAGDNAGEGNGGGIEIPSDAGPPPATVLGKGIVGKKCEKDGDCGTGATCAQTLTAGALGQLIGGTGPTRGYCTAECMTDDQCGEGGLCMGYYPQFGMGECRKPCKVSADCGRDDDYECATLTMPPLTVGGSTVIPVPDTCQPKQTPVAFTNQAGIACANDSACGGGTCRQGENFPGGYCSGSCFDAAACGTDGTCLSRPYGTVGSCFETCEKDSDCARDGEGYGCVDSAGTKVCIAKEDPLPDGVVGSACADDSMCANGVCATAVGPEQVETPGGYCSSLDCVEDAQCGAGGVCSPTMGNTRCYKGCAVNEDCRTDYSCVPRGDDKRNVCFPAPVLTP